MIVVVVVGGWVDGWTKVKRDIMDLQVCLGFKVYGLI